MKHAACVLAMACALAVAPVVASVDIRQVWFLEGRPFAGDTFEDAVARGADARRAVEIDVALLKSTPQLRYRVIGTTDSHECSGVECETLSFRRATLFRDALIAAGADPASLLPPVGIANREPQTDGATPEDREPNRRADLDPVLPKLGEHPSILELYIIGNFEPDVPSLDELQAELGPLRSGRYEGDTFYFYRPSDTTWLAFRANEATDPRYITADEVLLFREPPTKIAASLSPGKPLFSDRLGRVAIGDSIASALAQSCRGEKPLVDPVSLFGIPVTAYTCLSADMDFHRYYSRDGKTVFAMSIGVTE